MSGIQQLLGMGGATGNEPVSSITLASFSLFDLRPSGTATISYQLNADGNVYKIDHTGTVLLGAWCNPNGNASLYEYFVTLTSGTLTTGTVGSWVTGTQAWNIQAAAVSAKQTDFQVGVRLIGTTPVPYTADIHLDAEAGT